MYSRSFRILLIDDNPGDVWLLKEALRLAQVPVQMTIARDGIEAIECLRKVETNAVDCPDFIVLDLNLPRKNGHEVLTEIKASSGLRHIPVVVLSSSNAEEDRRNAYELSACCFVTKPNGLPAYVEMVRGMDRFWLSGLELRRPA
jgi:two-component system response regulator